MIMLFRLFICFYEASSAFQTFMQAIADEAGPPLVVDTAPAVPHTVATAVRAGKKNCESQADQKHAPHAFNQFS